MGLATGAPFVLEALRSLGGLGHVLGGGFLRGLYRHCPGTTTVCKLGECRVLVVGSSPAGMECSQCEGPLKALWVQHMSCGHWPRYNPPS